MGDKCPDENRNWIGFVTDWAHDIDSFLSAIWAEIGDFVTPRCGYAGLATLATQSDTGPQMRNLVIRDANRRDGLVHLHTDRQTPKVTEIDANSAASLLIWRPETQLQIRLGGRAEVLGAYAARQIWADVPFASGAITGSHRRRAVRLRPLAHISVCPTKAAWRCCNFMWIT